MNPRPFRLLTTTAAAALAILAGAITTASAAPAIDPIIAAGVLADPLTPGANDFTCKPTTAHPEPVVLVHAIGLTASANFSKLAPVIHKAGYCVFALNYGKVIGLSRMEESARELKTFVDGVLAATHAKRVNIVGQSQGSLMPRYYLRFLGGAAKTNDMIGVSAVNHGTKGTISTLPVGAVCGSCGEFAPGSPFLKKLNAGSEVLPGVSFTQIVTRFDQDVIPYTSGFLSGPRSQVTNVTVQDACPSDKSDHIGLAFDPVAHQWILNALGRKAPADPGLKPHC